MESSKINFEPPLKRFKKIPVYVIEEHNDALQFIYSAIGSKKLPVEGTALLHFDSHPDMLIDRKLKGEEARSGRKLLPLLQIENWIVPAAAAGHIGQVIWIRPPWACQFTDGTREIKVGDHPDTGLLRLDCKEPYYLSDALFSEKLANERKFTFTTAELFNADFSPKDYILFSKSLNIATPYILDIDLDFFSTDNPFLNMYKSTSLYDRLLPIFDFKLPDKEEDAVKIVKIRERQLEELDKLFEHLEENNNLERYSGNKTELYHKVNDLAVDLLKEADKSGESIDWWAVHAAGCTRDNGGLPCHISTEDQIKQILDNSFTPFLRCLPQPVLITVARSTDDGYCPSEQVDLIQESVLKVLKELYDTDEPYLYYFKANTL